MAEGRGKEDDDGMDDDSNVTTSSTGNGSPSLHNDFVSAANALTNLWRNGEKMCKDARKAGACEAYMSVLEWIESSVGKGEQSHQGLGRRLSQAGTDDDANGLVAFLVAKLADNGGYEAHIAKDRNLGRGLGTVHEGQNCASRQDAEQSPMLDVSTERVNSDGTNLEKHGRTKTADDVKCNSACGPNFSICPSCGQYTANFVEYTRKRARLTDISEKCRDENRSEALDESARNGDSPRTQPLLLKVDSISLT